jgi:drug/metabolite transporter (DMT)-like permease
MHTFMTGTQAVSPDRPAMQAYLVLALGVAATSMGAIFIRLAQAELMPSLVIAAGRLTIAALLLMPVALWNPVYLAQLRRLSGRDRLLIVVSGIFLAIHFASWVTSLEYTTVLISLVLVTTSPIWVALLEVFFLKLRLSQPIIAGLVVALAGGVLIGLSGSDDPTTGGSQVLGGALSTLGAVAMAIYLVIGRKLRAELALTPYIWLVYGVAALALLAVMAVTATPLGGYSLMGYAWVLALGLVPQLIGHSSLNYALAHFPATFISLSTQLEPLLSAAAAYFVFTEIPGPLQIAGGFVIMTGVILATLGRSTWRPRPRAPTA